MCTSLVIGFLLGVQQGITMRLVKVTLTGEHLPLRVLPFKRITRFDARILT